MIEVAEVIGIGLSGLKDHVGFHIIQGWTDRILVRKFFMGFPVITAHFGALFHPSQSSPIFWSCHAPKSLSRSQPSWCR